ncbi:MAG: hypothetical protein HY079_02170, partial [Elusimicrobia bacterium]|nr:hypothetical protein [Elusimicrobiota bacterium]
MLRLALILLSAALPSSAADLSSVDVPYFHRDEPGNLDKSLAAVDALLKAAPDDPDLLWRKGRALMRRGEKQARKAEKLADYLLAEDQLKKAVERAPSSADA